MSGTMGTETGASTEGKGHSDVESGPRAEDSQRCH